MTRKIAFHTALCLSVGLVCAAPGPGSAANGTREAMANAMSRMMEAMGLFDSGPTSGPSGSMPMDPTSMAGPWGSVAGPWGPGMPWGGPFQDPSRALQMGEMMNRFSRQMGAPAGTWSPSRLEGLWEGRNGELLIVQGERFRIYSPDVRRVDGLIQIREDRLALYNPLYEQAQAFQFAESDGRLVMRDLSGQVYLYRRLRLDGGAPPETAPER
jgi:hypothetical protein